MPSLVIARIQNIFMQIVRDIKKANSTNKNAELQNVITAETMKHLRLNMQKGSESINLRNITEMIWPNTL